MSLQGEGGSNRGTEAVGRQRHRWSNVATRTANSHQKLEEARKEPPLGPSKGAWPCPHLELGENKCLFLSVTNLVVICYGSPTTPTQPE